MTFICPSAELTWVPTWGWLLTYSYFEVRNSLCSPWSWKSSHISTWANKCHTRLYLNFNTCIEPTLRMARTKKLTEQKVILSMVSHPWRWLCCQGGVVFTKFQSNLARFMLISNQLKRREKSIGWVLNQMFSYWDIAATISNTLYQTKFWIDMEILGAYSIILDTRKL
jgi:hypothetical protein